MTVGTSGSETLLAGASALENGGDQDSCAGRACEASFSPGRRAQVFEQRRRSTLPHHRLCSLLFSARPPHSSLPPFRSPLSTFTSPLQTA